MRIWVTGAKGLVGSALCKILPAQVIATGREVDISQFDEAFSFAHRSGPITHIINCAAFSQVDLAETQKEKAYRDNALGPEVLGSIAKQIGAKLIHLSTDYVFDGAEEKLFSETDVPNPCNTYGESKWEGEKRLFRTLPEACIIRTSWVFGIGGKSFVAQLLEMLQTKDELQLVRDQFSRPTYVFDLCDAIVQMLDHSGLYHFANEGATNKYEFALHFSKVAQDLQIPLRCQTISSTTSSAFRSIAKRPLYTALDTTKIEPALKSPIRSWKDCLPLYLRERLR